MSRKNSGKIRLLPTKVEHVFAFSITEWRGMRKPDSDDMRLFFIYFFLFQIRLVSCPVLRSFVWWSIVCLLFDPSPDTATRLQVSPSSLGRTCWRSKGTVDSLRPGEVQSRRGNLIKFVSYVRTGAVSRIPAARKLGREVWSSHGSLLSQCSRGEKASQIFVRYLHCFYLWFIILTTHAKQVR